MEISAEQRRGAPYPGSFVQTNGIYWDLIRKCNVTFRTKYKEDRGEVSTFNRFKKLSLAVLKLIDIEQTTNKPSGDGDLELRFEVLCKELFKKRFKDDANIVDSVWSCAVSCFWSRNQSGWRIKRKKKSGSGRKQREIVQWVKRKQRKWKKTKS